MLYRFKKSTLRYREGDEIELRPDHEWTRLRLARGIVEPVRKPKAEKREKKVTKPSEYKHDSQDE